MIVRRLHSEDWKILRALRLAALRTDPTAFATSFEVSEQMAEAEWQEMLATRNYFAAFDGDDPIGLIALRPDDGESFLHRGVVLNVYVAERARGQGVGSILLEAIADHAKTLGILQLELGVRAVSEGAIRLYEKNGYEKIGTMPRGFRVGGKFYDEIYMIRFLDRA